MKILIIHPRMDVYGGAELLVVRLANYLSRNRIKNALLTTNITSKIAADLKGTEIISIPYKPLRGLASPLNLLRLLRRLSQGLRHNVDRFDLINVHNYPSEVILWPFQKPVVWMCNEPPRVHLLFDEERKFSPRWFLIRSILFYDKLVVRRRVTKTVVADEFNRKRFLNIYGLEAIINNYGIDCEYFRNPEPCETIVDKNRFTVLQVGMLTPLKNQLSSIKTIAQVRDKIPEVELILAGHGDGSYLKTIQDHIRDMELAYTVRITGHLDRGQIRNLYHNADVLLHPIRAQGGWLSPFEAICAGLPVIVSPEMTSSDIIASNDLGLVTSDYAGAILDVYKDPKKYVIAAARRSDWTATNLGWNSFCSNMVETFSSAIHAETNQT